MSRAKKARESIIPREEDYVRWRKLAEKNVVKEDFDKYGRKLYGRSTETKRVYVASANQTLHVRSFVKFRPLLAEQRCSNGGNGELPLLEYCTDGQTLRFARDPNMNEDDEKEIQEAQAHGDVPGATKFMHAFNSARLFDHTISQQKTFGGFMPSTLDIVMYGGQSCLVVYGEKGSGKSYALFGTDVNNDYSEPERPAEDEEEKEKENQEKERGEWLPHESDAEESDVDDGMLSDRDSETTDSEAQELKDIKWLQVDDDGQDTGLLQRVVEHLFDRIREGRAMRQSRYKIEMQCVASKDGSEIVYDMLSQDQNGRPVECMVQWEPASEKFEAVGAPFVAYKSRRDMIYAALRCNFLLGYLSMGTCSLVYRFRVEISGIGDPSWKTIVGDQLDEGQPRVGEFTLIKAASFVIGEEYPDDHGKDGVFKGNETLRFLVQTLEKQNYNNLPALRKKTVVPYRNNSVTKLMAPCLKPGSIVVFLGTAGIDRDSHVGTLHTLWAASCVNKARVHQVSFKRALNKLKSVNLLKKAGSLWNSRSAEDQEKRKLELKSLTFDVKQANMHHLLSDQARINNKDEEWTAAHQTQLERAMPRLERRVAKATAVQVSTGDVFVAGPRKKKSFLGLSSVIEEEDILKYEDEEKNERERFRYKRTRGALHVDAEQRVKNDLLTPMLGILKFDRIDVAGSKGEV